MSLAPLVRFGILGFFLFFSLSLFANTRDEVRILLDEGTRLADQENFSESLKVLNRAMGLLRQIPSTDPLRVETEKLIRMTKGRFLVTRYRSGKLAELPKTNQLIPLIKESRDFLVKQVFGSVLARKVWENRDKISTNQTLGSGRRLTVLPNGGIEIQSLQENGLSLRTIQAASFDLAGSNEVHLHSGSFVLHVLGEQSSMLLQSPLTEIRLESEDPFAIMVGITTNGGMKIICLLGKIQVKSNTSRIELLPGELSFALPEGFSRKMNVELSTLMVTANLITGFDKPLPYLKKLRQQAMMQAMRTNKRFRTVVGDVKGNDDFELKVLREENP